MIARHIGRPEFWAAADAASPLCLTALRVAADSRRPRSSRTGRRAFSPEVETRALADDTFEITLSDGSKATVRVEPADEKRPERVVWLELRVTGLAERQTAAHEREREPTRPARSHAN